MRNSSSDKILTVTFVRFVSMIILAHAVLKLAKICHFITLNPVFLNTEIEYKKFD